MMSPSALLSDDLDVAARALQLDQLVQDHDPLGAEGHVRGADHGRAALRAVDLVHPVDDRVVRERVGLAPRRGEDRGASVVAPPDLVAIVGPHLRLHVHQELDVGVVERMVAGDLDHVVVVAQLARARGSSSTSAARRPRGRRRAARRTRNLLCCRLGASTFVMHEWNVNAGLPQSTTRSAPRAACRSCTTGCVRSPPSMTPSTSTPRTMRRDQRIGDRPAVEVAEREADVLARRRRLDERDRVLLQREVRGRDLARILEQRAVADLAGGRGADAVLGERERHGQRAASGDPRDRRPRDHGSPPGVGTELRPYAQRL